MANAFVAAGTDTQPQRFVLADADTLNAVATVWLSTDSPVDVRANR